MRPLDAAAYMLTSQCHYRFDIAFAVDADFAMLR